MHELWVVESCHPFAVTLEVREFLNEGATGQPGEGLDQLVVHEVQVSNVLAAQVRGVARNSVNRSQQGSYSIYDGFCISIGCVARSSRLELELIDVVLEHVNSADFCCISTEQFGLPLLGDVLHDSERLSDLGILIE